MLRVLLRVLLCSLALVALGSAPARAAGPLDRLPPGLQLGMYSPDGQAAAERASGFGLRTLYLTGGPGHWGAAGTRAWLDESRAAGMVPVLTYYQLQPGAPKGSTELTRVRDVLRSRPAMKRYWADVRRAMRVAGADRQQLVVLQIEPDGWEFMDQLGGVRTRAVVGSSGMRELRGLRNDVGGFARAFVRLRDRYAPNVALAFHLSRWGTGQSGVPSVANSEQVGHLRATYVRALGARFDLALHDPGDPPWDSDGFQQHLALLRAFHGDTGLPIVLFQVPADDRIDDIIGPDPAARARLAAEESVGVVGMLFDAGTPDAPAPARSRLFQLAARAASDGVLSPGLAPSAP